jgi:tRNA(Ile)-lysidine synthase
MALHRTDRGKIPWPKGILAGEKQLCRKIYSALEPFRDDKQVIIACSGGIDSTVLAHAFACAHKLKGFSGRKHLLYVNHGLRPANEIKLDVDHVSKLAVDLNYDGFFCRSVCVEDGNTQAMARKARYDAINKEAVFLDAKVLLAHHADDLVETKLWQFLTGRRPTGVSQTMSWNGEQRYYRPFLPFSREDLTEYARIWQITWVEDSSNATDKYVRNVIRHELIPFIKTNINPGILKTLCTGSRHP